MRLCEHIFCKELSQKFESHNNALLANEMQV